MLKRTLTGAGIVTVVYLVVYLAEAFPRITAFAAGLLAAAAVYELYQVAGISSNGSRWLAALIGALAVLLPIPGYTWILTVLLPVAVAAFGFWMAHLKNGAGKRWYIYPVCVAVVMLFKAIPDLNRLELVAAITLCFVTDVAAYLIGSRFGRHKLAKVISPHKTIEGSVAGIISAVGFMLLYGFVLRAHAVSQWHPGKLALYGFSASIIAQFGDLAMSTVKRSFGVKDFGKILPGHGGILDRFDSHIFCIAYTVIYCIFAGGLFD